MNFLFFWLLTIILSYGFYIDLFYRMIKDFANRGYVLNIKKVKLQNVDTEINETLTNENNIKIPYLIPVLNLISVFSLGQQYVENKTIIFNRLKGLLYLSPMTDEERQQYKEKPSVGSIFLIMKEREIIEEQKKLIIEKLEISKNEEVKGDVFQEETNILKNNFLYNEIDNLEEKPKVKTLSRKK